MKSLRIVDWGLNELIRLIGGNLVGLIIQCVKLQYLEISGDELSKYCEQAIKKGLGETGS